MMKKRFIPKKPASGKDQTKYFYINSEGQIHDSNWSPFNDIWDRKRFAWGNCFKSKAAAVKAKRYLRIALLNFHKTDL